MFNLVITFLKKQFALLQGGQSPCQTEHCRPTNEAKNSSVTKESTTIKPRRDTSPPFLKRHLKD